MAYVNVADWKPEQVTEWLKGLDSVLLPYVYSFVNNEVDGKQLLALRPDDLQNLGILKVGHQEIILEAVEHLRHFHYELDRENVQQLALRLSCQAHSLHRAIAVEEKERAAAGGAQSVSTQTLADVAGVITCIKPLALWLDRPPFCDLPIYQDLRTRLLSHGLNIATCAQRDRFAERPVDEIRQHCEELARLADQVIQEYSDPLILQPASLDLATIKKRAGDDVGFFLAPSLSGAHQIVEVKLQGPAHQSGKVEGGDEIVQVNYQTVVGWRLKAVWLLVQEASTQVFLTLKKRPRHSNVYGQIYIKPYRLPSRKRNPPFLRWHENLPSPRPELLTIPHFELPLPTARLEGSAMSETTRRSSSSSSVANTSDEEDDSAFAGGEAAAGGTSSPCSVRLLLPRPRSAVQRRATVSGASPTAKHPPHGFEQLLAEINREMMRRGIPPMPRKPEDSMELRGKSGSAMSLMARPNTVLGSVGSNSPEPRSPLSPLGLTRLQQQISPLVPASSRLQQTSSGPARTPPQPAPRNVHVTLLQGPPPAALHVSPPYQAPGKPAPTPRELVRPQRPSPSYVESTRTLDILPDHAVPSTSTAAPPVILLESEGSGDTLHERAVDCSPVPPPRPASSLRPSATTSPRPSPGTSMAQGARSLVARTVSRTRQRLSPRSDRKKASNLLSKGRLVSCKQLGEAECEGWLLQRARAAAGASWSRAWFVLKEDVLYGFPSIEATKAAKLIAMAGLTAAAAPEVKSRQFAFKVYHTGKAFYFAAGCADELSRWLGCLTAATLGTRGARAAGSAPYFSETEDEEQPTRPPVRAASSGNVSADQETKGERFGSLRRLAGWRTDEGATSLDRKYLPRLLRQEAVVPVPTAQFRSYRRVDRPGPPSVADHSRTLPTRLSSQQQQQQRVMSMDQMAAASSTSSLPLQQSAGLHGSSPHLALPQEAALGSDKTSRSGRMLRLFSPGLSRKFGGGAPKVTAPGLEGAVSTPAPTLLGSPKLHRALFRGRRHAAQPGKQAMQVHRVSPSLPEESPSPAPTPVPEQLVPDYPNLEYPPVFEPGTYTLNPVQFHASARPPARMSLVARDVCWPTQSMNLAGPSLSPRNLDMAAQRRVRLTPAPPLAEGPVRRQQTREEQRSGRQNEAVLIPSLDLLSSTDV